MPDTRTKEPEKTGDDFFSEVLCMFVQWVDLLGLQPCTLSIASRVTLMVQRCVYVLYASWEEIHLSVSRHDASFIFNKPVKGVALDLEMTVQFLYWRPCHAALCIGRYILYVLRPPTDRSLLYWNPSKTVFTSYRSDTVNSKWFVSKVLLRIKCKFELQDQPIVVSVDSD